VIGGSFEEHLTPTPIFTAAPLAGRSPSEDDEAAPEQRLSPRTVAG
jgi:hypothetical protein